MLWVTLSPYSGDDPSVVSLAPRGPRSLLRDATVRTSALRKAVLDVARQHSARAAWVVAHGASVRLIRALVAAGLPLHVTIHDDPAWGNAILTRRYACLAPILALDLRRSLPRAQSADVVSPGMADRYRRLFGIESVLVHRGLPEQVAPAPPYADEGVSVAVLGSTYGLAELSLLAQALSVVQQQLGTSARLLVIGGVVESELHKLCPPNVDLEITGHLPESEGIARLRGAFLLYLSYPFGRRGAILRRTSFPTKLSTYVQAARPLLLHTPSDSSITSLGSLSPYTSLWSSQSAEDGAELIMRRWSEPAMKESFHAEADALRTRQFNLERNRVALMRALCALPADPARSV